MKQHQRAIHESCDMFSCTGSCTHCDYTTPLKSNLKRHLKRHNNISPDHNIPHKIAHCESIPNIIDPLTNDNLLQDIEQQEIQTMFERNTQVGFGIMQITPADENIPHDLEMNNLRAQTEIFDNLSLCPKFSSNS